MIDHWRLEDHKVIVESYRLDKQCFHLHGHWFIFIQWIFIVCIYECLWEGRNTKMNKTWLFLQRLQCVLRKRDKLTSCQSGIIYIFTVLRCPFYEQHIMGTSWFLTARYSLQFEFLLKDYISPTGKPGETIKPRCPQPSTHQQTAT